MKLRGSDQDFDAAAIKREFPGLSNPRLHYLDNAATAQMPEVVLGALRRFEVEARANVHEGVHRLARAATAAYDQARSRVARFLHAYSAEEIIFTYGATSSINLQPFPSVRYSSPAMKSCCRFSNTMAKSAFRQRVQLVNATH